MHRFFLSPEHRISEGEVVSLPKDLVHQIQNVLHLHTGEQIVLFDNSGDELLSVITASSRSIVEVEVRERRVSRSKLEIQIVLCPGLLKATTRFEWLLEKGTELGVAAFAPIVYHRSVAGLEEAGSKKIQRWQRIMQEACEQCGRAQLPTLLPIRPLAQALADIGPDALAIMPWEEAQEPHLHDVLRTIHPPTNQNTATPRTIHLFIGPEGGLTNEEITRAQNHGAHIVTLGPRILRAETAAIAAVANIFHELEAH